MEKISRASPTGFSGLIPPGFSVFDLLPALAKTCAFTLVFIASASKSVGAESWQSALVSMPLNVDVAELNSSNAIQVMLSALQSNEVVKALVFMPGATDEFYFFHRARVKLTNHGASLLDAVQALQTQTRIRATFHAPLLLLHSEEDQLEPAISVENDALLDKIRNARFVPHGIYIDRDWDYMQPILRKYLKVEVLPARYSSDSWHFYRHSFAAWNLNGWEALESTVLAGKTRCSIQKQGGLSLRRTVVVFAQDRRMAPKR